ncbi:MAG: hypothetical protein U0166_08060 [Acidobacteriota bacterium]
MASTTSGSSDGVGRLARSLATRYRLRKLLHGAFRGLAVAALGAVILVAAHRLVMPRVAPAAIVPWLVGLPISGIVVGALLHLLPAMRRLSHAELLALADRAYGTRELLLTAADRSAESGAMVLEVKGQAAGAASAISPGRVLPLRIPREASACALLVAVLALSPFVPQYVPQAVAKELEDKRATTAAGEKLKEEIARLEKEAAAPPSKDEQKALLAAQKLAENMAKGDLDRLTSLEKLAEAQEEAGKAKQDTRFDQVESSFSRAAKEIEKSGLKGDLSHALAASDAAAIKEELKKLADELEKPSKLGKEELNHIAEAFSRMSKTLERQGEQALAAAADEAAKALESGNAEQGAKAIDKLAKAEDLENVVKDGQKSKEAARALDAAEETQPAVEKMRSQDSQGTRSELAKLAKAIREGKKPGSFDDKQRQSVAKALKQLSNDLADTQLKSLAKNLGEAGQELEKGDLKSAAQSLKDIDPDSLQACKAMREGDARMADLSRVLAEARSLMGQSQQAQKGQGQSLDDLLNGTGGEPGADYGVGTSKDDQGEGRQADSVHHNRDRQGDSRSTWTEAYEKKYESLRLPEAEGSPTFVHGKTSGAADYVEFRGLPGQEQSMMDVGAPPPNYRKAAEDALSNEEIPPGYRDQIKDYFDGMPKPDGGAAPAATGAEPAAGSGKEQEKK